jgi:hypothetical protein
MTSLPELEKLDAILATVPGARVELLATVEHGGIALPIRGIVLGAEARTAPTFAVVGGVHGIERIGTEVVLAYLTTLAALLEWDGMLATALRSVRIVIVPLVNPVGMWLGRRANGRGVDLMRNAPAHPRTHATMLVGGQSVSPLLPWFCGWPDEAMEIESAALCEFVRREVLCADTAILLDVHSGFGLVDRIWFPWARTRRPLPHLPEVFALKRLLDRTLPNHVYRIEPQAQAYTARGDLWDHLYDEQLREHAERTFLPLTLELGSWAWVRKNPRQALRASGSFNPVRPHRLRRTLRRHMPLFDVLQRASAAPFAWTGFDAATRAALHRAAFDLWYGSDR